MPFVIAMETATGVKTDQREWLRLYTLGTNEATAEDFAKTNLQDYMHKLSPSDLQELAKLLKPFAQSKPTYRLFNTSRSPVKIKETLCQRSK